MADHKITLRELRRILTRFSVWEDQKRGKGSHTMFFREIRGCRFGFPVPTHDKDVPRQYITSLRRKFELTESHGISDRDFYGLS